MENKQSIWWRGGRGARREEAEGNGGIKENTRRRCCSDPERKFWTGPCHVDPHKETVRGNHEEKQPTVTVSTDHELDVAGNF